MLRPLKTGQIFGMFLKNPPFSLRGGFDDEEIAVEGKSAEHYGADQPQYVDAVVLSGTRWVLQQRVRNENRPIFLVVAGKDDKVTHGLTADVIEEEIVTFRVFSGGIVKIGGAQS